MKNSAHFPHPCKSIESGNDTPCHYKGALLGPEADAIRGGEDFEPVLILKDQFELWVLQ